jgi:dUTP pyrophosphatase
MRVHVLDRELYEGDSFRAKHEGDAGIDLRLARDVSVEPGETVKVPLGVAILLPPATVGWITSRSSAALRGALIHEGKIDEGYTGVVHAIITNSSDGERITMRRGERVVQLLVLPILRPVWEVRYGAIDVETSRGSDGFGSTG